ncbi:MAG: CotH kinase family protein [candidate division KSB1 bacterium]|nr:CotH kinase family protein [candidate division KSB1 bacterium]
MNKAFSLFILILCTVELPPSAFGEELESEAVTLTSSNLPILLIDTRGRAIPDSFRIPAKLEVKYRTDGSRNFINDPSLLQVDIAIEIRGSSSAYFDKKSYGFETRDSAGNNLNVSLLDMPRENDWILYGPYSDKSLIRNVLTFNLGRSMGRYASRTRFCELVLNGRYQGLYVLMEKIKRDRNRVAIAELKPDDNQGDAVTGGYILKVDKRDTNPPGWTSPARPVNGGEQIFFQYVYPKAEEITPEQKHYIQNYIYQFEAALNSANYRDRERGYLPFVDELSFVDMMIINELTKNIDGYRFSTFMYKDRGGPLTMGPIWDYDLGFGNVDYGHERAMHPDGWMYNQSAGRMYWWPRMMQNYRFKLLLSRRWYDLRRSSFSNGRVLAVIDSLTQILDEAQKRNFQRWPVLGVYLWPNFFIGKTFTEEIDYLKSWILNRLEWMDRNMPYPNTSAEQVDEEIEGQIVVFPNPFRDKVEFYLSPSPFPREVRIYNLLGQLVTSLNLPCGSTPNYITWMEPAFDYGTLNAGIYFYHLFEDGKAVSHGRLVKIK